MTLLVQRSADIGHMVISNEDKKQKSANPNDRNYRNKVQGLYENQMGTSLNLLV